MDAELAFAGPDAACNCQVQWMLTVTEELGEERIIRKRAGGLLEILAVAILIFQSI